MHRLLLITLCLALLAASCSKTPSDKLHTQLGRGYEQLEKYQFAQADSTFSMDLKANPSSPIGLYGKGLLHERRLELYDALDKYTTALAADPSFAPAWEACTRLLRTLKEPDVAATYATGFVRRSDNPASANIDLAAAWLDGRKYGQARLALHAADSLGVEKTWLDLMAARAYALKFNVDSAKAAFARAENSKAASPRWYQYAADYYEALGMSDSAIAMSRNSMNAKGADQGDLYAHFLRCLNLRYDTEAEGLLKTIAEKAGNDYGAMAAAIRYNVAIANFFAADSYVNKMTRRKEQLYSTLMYEAEVRWAMADFQTTFENLETVARDVKAETNNPDFADYMLGVIVLFENQMGDDETVYKRIQNVGGFRTERLPFRFAQAEMFLRGGGDEPFAQAVKVMEDSHGKDPDWLVALGRLHWGRVKRDTVAAQKYFSKALEVDPTYEPAMCDYIDMFTLRAEFPRALQLFSQYPQFERNPDMQMRKAYCQIRAGQPDNGTSTYLQAMTAFPANISRHDSMYTFLLSRGFMSHAAQVAQRSLELNSNDPLAYALAARSAIDQGDYQKGVDLADKGTAINDNIAKLGVQKARAWYLSGRKADGVALFESLIKKFKADPDVLYNFSHCLASDKSELNRAADLARQGQFVEAGSYRSTMNLSYVYAQAGSAAEARAEAERVYGVYPYEPEVAYMMAVMLAKEGKHPQAKTFLDRAIALGLAGPMKERAQQSIGTF